MAGDAAGSFFLQSVVECVDWDFLLPLLDAAVGGEGSWRSAAEYARPTSYCSL
jgi:hypothetical protein